MKMYKPAEEQVSNLEDYINFWTLGYAIIIAIMILIVYYLRYV